MDSVDNVEEKYDQATRKISKSDALEDIHDLKEKLEKNHHFVTELSNKNEILRNENKKLKEERAVLVKEKDEALSRLSKLAGQKLTEGNPAITDLGNPNRPAKIGERWASLYSDEWTDVFEEIIQKNEKMENKDETPEKQLLKLVDWCYKQCTEIFNSQTTAVHEKVRELASILHLPGVKEITLKKNERINAYDQKGKENAVLIESIESFLQNAKDQRQCSSTLVDSVKKICSDNYNSLTTSGTEKEFVRKCSELCWYMVSADPPMAIEYENFENKSMDSNKFNKYNRTGTIVEYVVWPVLLLHIDGPVLAKGTVQTNYKPDTKRTAARKKSVDKVIALPIKCKSVSSDDVHIKVPSQSTRDNETKDNNKQDKLISDKIVTRSAKNKLSNTGKDQLDQADDVLDLEECLQKDQSILSKNNGKTDNNTYIGDSGSLTQSNSIEKIVISPPTGIVSNFGLIEEELNKSSKTGCHVNDEGCTASKTFDESRSRDFKNNEKTIANNNLSNNPGNITDAYQSATGISTNISQGSKTPLRKSKLEKEQNQNVCEEFKQVEETFVQSIKENKYGTHYIRQNSRTMLQKSKSLSEDQDNKTNQTYDAKIKIEERKKSKCEEFKHVEETFVQSIKDNKYGKNYIRQNSRTMVQKSKSLTEDHDNETNQTYDPSYHNSKPFLDKSHSLLTLSPGPCIKSKAVLSKTNNYSKSEDQAEGNKVHTDTLKKDFEKISQRDQNPISVN